MIVFNDTLGAYGGSHTLMLRMCTWLKQHNIRTGIFCDNRNNDEIAKELEGLGVEIFVIDIQNPKAVCTLLNKIKNDVKIINFSWNFYLDMERAKKVGGLQFDNLVYCIHEGTFQKGSGFRSTFMRNISVKKYKGIFEKMGKNCALIMMDEICLKISKEFLNANLDNVPPILRIPMKCDELSKSEIRCIVTNAYNNKLIMTASRAEIPYKGYLLGMIDDFKVLKEKHPDISLEIVSAGDDIGQIENRIRELPAKIRDDIKLHGWMDYKSLKKLIESCTIFIGMGTSILDAALKYKPAVPVKFNTVKNLADSLFSDNPINICAEEQCERKAVNLIDDVLRLSEQEYEKLCNMSFNAVKENYDIEAIMMNMTSIRTLNKKCILSSRECLLHMMNNKLNRIRYRNTNKFDYRTISRNQ